MRHAYRPTVAHFDADALRHNLAIAREHGGDSRLMAVIKADAYGHGMEKVAAIVEPHCEEVAVVSLDDALRLRRAGIANPIVLLSGFYNAAEIAPLSENAVSPVIYEPKQIEWLRQQPPEKKLSVWLKVDSGMGRLGVPLSDCHRHWQELAQIENVERLGLLSHFANADQPEHPLNRLQLQRFQEVANLCMPKQLSLANSAAIVSNPNAHFDLNRAGIMLYGAAPLADKSAEDLGLRPVMTLQSQIIAVKSLNKGDSIGYGSTWVCPEAMRVGVVACGYGDGYPRHAPTGTPVLVDDQRSRLLGRVSMDSISVDLSAIDAGLGSAVTLWGKGLPVDEVAQSAGTIGYELLCGVTARVQRKWNEIVDNG